MSKLSPSFPPNAAFSWAEPASGERLLSPFPQSHTQPEPRGNEFIDTEGRSSLKSNKNGQHSTSRGGGNATDEPRLCPTQKLGRNLAEEKGVLSNSSPPQSYALLPAPAQHRTQCHRCFLNCSVNDFYTTPAGLGANHLPAHVGSAQGLGCSSSAPLSSPQPEHRGTYTETPPSSGSCSSLGPAGASPGTL